MKTMMQNKINKLAALFLIAVMCFGLAAPYMAAPEENTIYIRTAEDLVELSKNCSYDKWSVGKKVVLSNDVSLAGVEFEPIPYFAGTFDGQGYTISAFELGGSYYPAGLFGITNQGAFICNLNVIGSVIPEGDKEAVGGIVGINGGVLQNVSFSGVVSGEVAVGGLVGLNKTTGVIENSLVQGSIFGEHGTGGIAGRNLGKIINCENEAYVNNTSVDSTVSLEELDSNILQSFYTMNSSDVMNAFTDSGGIAGYSSGMIIGCTNEGTIGYPRVGYNAGGIIGRNCGYVQACVNNGEVLGRKDIGGIVGQVEPFLDVEVDISDLSVVDTELETLKNQVDELSSSAESTTNDIQTNLDQIYDYIEDAAEALDILSESDNQDTQTSEKNELPEDIEIPEEIEDVEIPEWDGETSSNSEAVSTLSDSLNGISDELRSINEKVDDGAGELDSDLDSINNQLSAVSDSVMDMLENMKNFTPEDVIADTSNVNIEDVIYGKITDCINEGRVEGDLNAGGIAGIMSLEYEVDPEDDTSMDISWTERKQYEVKAVLINCINKGEISAKKNNVAGICGQMDIGIIKNCFAYGSISSEDGDYVGGIAGIASTTVTDCIANCGLSGNSYVGGIIGCGFTDEEEDGGSIVSNCYSLVKITECEQYAGAIAGCEEGSFRNNYFVSNELQGINRISYEGVAQPISYEELIQIPNIPEELKGFTLTFVAEDKVIESIDFNYGDSFGKGVFPKVPEKEGYDGAWDTTDLSNLCFDTVVTAEYTLYVTALQSEAIRENGRPVFLIEGNFSNEDMLIATSETITEELMNELGLKIEAAEYWKINFSDDGQKRHCLRFLPDEALENAKLYVKEDGTWTKVETGDFGSYKTFQVVGNEVELAIVPIRYEAIGFVLLIALVIALIVGFVLLEKKTHICTGFFKKVLKKFGVKKLIIFFIALGVIGSVFSIAYVANLPRIRISAELAALTSDVISAKNQSMNLDLTADVGGNHIELDSKVYVLNENETSIMVLEENNHAVYFVEGNIYLENGKAYRLGEAENPNSSLLEQIRKLYEATEIERTTLQDKTVYSITTTGEDANSLMAVLVPSTEGQIASAGDTVVRIIARDGILQSVEVEGSATLKNAMETKIEVSAVISNISQLDEGEYMIPETITDAIANTEEESLSVVGEEMYRLMLAWIEFNSAEQNGMVNVDVSCGPINLESEYDWTDITNGISEVANASNIEKLPDLVYQVCMNGEFTCEKLGSNYIFQLTLNEEEMKQLAETIAPELATQTIHLTDGVVEVVIENNEISSFEIRMEGIITVLFSDVDASVKAEFTFE